jgi:uncharacterized protein (TIGR00106 family)
MLAQFSIVPLGTGSSISDKLSIVLKIIDDSGMPYKINPMGTVVEGEWEEIMGLINRCRQELLKTEQRVLISISIDDRKGATDRLTQKVASVERKLGRTLKQ